MLDDSLAGVRVPATTTNSLIHAPCLHISGAPTTNKLASQQCLREGRVQAKVHPEFNTRRQYSYTLRDLLITFTILDPGFKTAQASCKPPDCLQLTTPLPLHPASPIHTHIVLHTHCVTMRTTTLPCLFVAVKMLTALAYTLANRNH